MYLERGVGLSLEESGGGGGGAGLPRVGVWVKSYAISPYLP